MSVMISAQEYAERNGYKVSTLHDWLALGLVPGARKIPCPSSFCKYAYSIPEDAVPKQLKRGRPSGKNKPPVPQPVPWSDDSVPAASGKKKNGPEISAFIRRHCGSMTYGQISAALGISSMECRRVYDRLHEQYQI